MPSASVILDQLFQIANRHRELAIGWHLLVAALIAGLASGWRPSGRVVALLLAAPPLSVSVVAARAGNPVNAGAFALLVLVLVASIHTWSRRPIALVTGVRLILPAVLIAYGLFYPHFLQGARWYSYLYAAPAGLLPCPTLALLAGITLLVARPVPRWWWGVLAAAALVYGAFGMFRLGVRLDAPLLLAAVPLGLRAARREPGREPSGHQRRRDGLLAYFVGAFAISWGGVGLAVAFGPARPGAGQAGALLMFLAMLAGPSVASLLLTAVLEGRAGLSRLRMLRWRLRPGWYALPLLAPALLALLLLALSLRGRQFLPAVATAGSPWTLVGTAVLVGLAAGCFEELGWTGFATPRLLARGSAFRAGVTLGLPWAAWHALPDHVGTAASFGSLWVPHMIEWLVALTAFRVLMTWAYARTSSLPLAVLMHAGFTGGQLLLWPGAEAPRDGLLWYGAFGVLLWLAVLGLLGGTAALRSFSSHAPAPGSARG